MGGGGKKTQIGTRFLDFGMIGKNYYAENEALGFGGKYVFVTVNAFLLWELEKSQHFYSHFHPQMSSPGSMSLKSI